MDIQFQKFKTNWPHVKNFMKIKEMMNIKYKKRLFLHHQELTTRELETPSEFPKLLGYNAIQQLKQAI